MLIALWSRNRRAILILIAPAIVFFNPVCRVSGGQAGRIRQIHDFSVCGPLHHFIGRNFQVACRTLVSGHDLRHHSRNRISLDGAELSGRFSAGGALRRTLAFSLPSGSTNRIICRSAFCAIPPLTTSRRSISPDIVLPCCLRMSPIGLMIVPTGLSMSLCHITVLKAWL